MGFPYRAKACAKINLFLEITGKRADGYHTLSTVFQTISLADELTFRPHDVLQMSCSDCSLPTDDRNLVMRAARRIQTALKEKRGAAIDLKKVVPMGAGLGGGSGDAGLVLTALPKLWKRTAGATLLHRVARTLGADVPFFLKGGTCAAGGIGDRLRPLPALPRTWLVLVYPGFGVPTKDAYGRVRVPVTELRSARRMIPLLSRRSPSAWVDHLFNRFEEFVFPLYPRLARLKRELLGAGALGALMSGSGSSVFGVVKNEAQGRRVRAAVRKKYPQSWLVHTL